MNFTQRHLDNWRRYERVRQGGRWNMFFPQAQKATGLSGKDYSFVMRHYVELKAAVERSLPDK